MVVPATPGQRDGAELKRPFRAGDTYVGNICLPEGTSVRRREVCHSPGRIAHRVGDDVIERNGIHYATTTGEQGSGILTSMVHANALVVIGENVTLARSGESVMAQMLDWPEVE